MQENLGQLIERWEAAKADERAKCEVYNRAAGAATTLEKAILTGMAGKKLERVILGGTIYLARSTYLTSEPCPENAKAVTVAYPMIAAQGETI